MSIFEQAHKAYVDSLKNNFWNAWGIVASPITIYRLRAERTEKSVVHNGGTGELEKLFGLVVIPCDIVEEDKMYIVDEQLGRMILEASRKGANNG